MRNISSCKNLCLELFRTGTIAQNISSCENLRLEFRCDELFCRIGPSPKARHTEAERATFSELTSRHGNPFPSPAKLVSGHHPNALLQR
jgi:hypothetical protein